MKKLIIKLIKSYQNIPGNFHYACKFSPTCSQYAIEAIEEYGVFIGCFLSIKRIIRCNPLSKGGYDPVKKGVKEMKKKMTLFTLLCMITVSLTGCFKSDTMENITIYTTVYPIEYITTKLYGEYSTINSIYPDGVNVNSYSLTSKQIKDYSASDLYIFNGLNNEKDYVAKLFKYNKKIKIIDATASMEMDYRNEELWLNPSNLLMIAQNIKNGFNEYLTNHYIKNDIEENYDNLKINISNLDANISNVINNASDKNIIVSDDLFLYLSKYGFNVISLDSDTATDKTIAQAKQLIDSGDANYIFVPNGDDLNNIVKNVIEDTGAEVKYLYTLSTISEQDRSNKKDYISIMNENLELLKEEIYN